MAALAPPSRPKDPMAGISWRTLQKVVVAYPDSVGGTWNAGGDCCGRPARERIDDVGVIAAAIGDINMNVGVDPARVYATGISNSGMMAYCAGLPHRYVRRDRSRLGGAARSVRDAASDVRHRHPRHR
jgi:hypothetical protein